MAAAACDHVVWYVDDLGEATAAWEDAGYRVTPGGTHAGGLTSNALVAFADGTYVELLRVNLDRPADLARRLRATRVAPWALRGRSALDRRFVPGAGDGTGARDWALGVADLDRVVTRIRTARLSVDGPYPGARVRGDGRRVAWRLGMPRDRGFPFLIEDVTPRALRVPSGDAVHHRNGAIGIARIGVRTPDPDGVLGYLRVLLEAGPREDGECLSFSLSNCELTVRRRPHPPLEVDVELRGTSGAVRLPDV